MIHFILGGQRSGKSRFAENQIIQLCQENKLNEQQVTYIATAQKSDSEMQLRIEKHQNDRPQNWNLIESPIELTQSLKNCIEKKDTQIILIDCLTLWLNNLLFKQPDQMMETISEFVLNLEKLSQQNKQIYIVSNEVGLGVIPLGEVSRVYVDELGRLNQQVAKISTNVWLLTAGIEQKIK